jgi:hypothetical protein
MAEATPQTYQRAAEQKHQKLIRHREQRRADRRDQQQHALDPPWTISVEEDADGYLGGCERHEVNRRKQAKVVGTEAQFRRQWGRHDRVNGPEQIGDIRFIIAGSADILPRPAPAERGRP